MEERTPVLITGGSGQLGQCLKRTLAEDRTRLILAPSRRELDITKPEEISRYLEAHRPAAVVHCAGYSFVDRAEDEPELCFLVNGWGTARLAEAAARIGAYLLYISTDYVFDGEKRGQYLPEDRKHPLSVYGKSKAEGEEAVLSSGGENAVLRTAWLFGHGSRNFVEAILSRARQQATLEVVADQYGSPTYAEDLAKLIEEMLRKRTKGILHGTNEGSCSWAEFAERIIGLSGYPAKVKHISSQEYSARAARPGNSVLSKDCLDAAGLHRLPPWEDALRRYLLRERTING